MSPWNRDQRRRALYYVGVFLLAVVCGALFVLAANGGRFNPHAPPQDRTGDAGRMTE